MNRKIVGLGLLIAIISVSALGSGFMGPPTAELEEGQWSIGYTYTYIDADLENMNIKYVEYDNGAFNDSFPVKLKVEDVKVNRHYATVGYGLAEWWQVYFQLGGADVKAKLSEVDNSDNGMSFNFDNDFAWGWGTKFTLCDQGDVRWGTSIQMNWLDTSMSSKYSEPGYSEKDSYDFETMDLLIAFGPTVDMGGWKLYGGPFYYYLSGDYDNKGSATDGFTWKENGDLDNDSSFGGFIGAQLPLWDNTDMTAELSFTGDSWALGTGITWKF